MFISIQMVQKHFVPNLVHVPSFIKKKHTTVDILESKILENKI